MEEMYNEQKKNNEEVRTRFSKRLVQSGEKDRLKELLRRKLVECGWHDEMQLHCKEMIRHKGIDQVSVEDLIEEITPVGRASVPEAVKNYLLTEIKALIVKEASVKTAEINS
ncbi:putative transcription factor, enhancer of yellow 2, transcription factor EnY2 superfamily [Plasmopara halstedii]